MFENRHSSAPFDYKNRVQSQQIGRRTNIRFNSQISENGLFANPAQNNQKRYTTKAEWDSPGNLTDDLIHNARNTRSSKYTKDNFNESDMESVFEYRPKKVIPMNIMTSGNIRGVSLNTNQNKSKFERFKDKYISKYSQRHFASLHRRNISNRYAIMEVIMRSFFKSIKTFSLTFLVF